MNKISILLAVYNGEDYIEESISSVVNQTYTNWELIVVDNGSTDNTFEIIKKVSNNDKRISLHKLSEKGKCKAYNYAYLKSNGHFICFLAADDTLTINSLESRLTAIIDKNGFSTCLLKTFSLNANFDSLIFPKNIHKPNLSGGSIFFKRDIANKIFPIPEILPNEDTWTSLTLETFSKCHHIPEVLYNYRIHSSNSFGYNLSYEDKRTKYLERMQAYILFQQKWGELENFKLKNHFKSFITGLDYCKNKKVFKIIFLKNLSIKYKIIFIYYSSEFLFDLRNKYFKFFSGFFN
jgi:glycosyltransferase involved in cell wall biosynthesis